MIWFFKVECRRWMGNEQGVYENSLISHKISESQHYF